MKTHFDLSDPEFLTQFENCELDSSIFNHEAHLRLAWLYIKNNGIDEAVERVQIHLIDFVEHLEQAKKYNKTLTIAAIFAVYHFILKSNSNNFKDFITEFPQLNNNFKDLIETHYRLDIFNSEKAKTEFIKPDLLPFDK